MKKTLLIALLSFPFFCFSQTYYAHGELYLNALLTIPDQSDIGTYDVIRDIQSLKNVDAKWGSSKTMRYDKFKGDTLEVIKVVKYVDEAYPSLSGHHLYLKSRKTGDLYGFEFSQNLPFKVVKQAIPITKDAFCADITSSDDKFTDSKTFRSPKTGSNYGHPGITVSKVVKGNVVSYYLVLGAWDKDPSGTLKDGVIILFDDGTKMNFADASIDVNVNNIGSLGGFNYSSVISIAKDNLPVFTSKKITGYRLYLTDTNVNSYDGTRVMCNMQCMVDKN